MFLHRIAQSLSVLAVIASAAPAFATGVPVVNAKYETQAFLETDHDADADDPAIWVHPTNKSRSLVIGTLKNGGLAVFDLQGHTLQRILAPAAPSPEDTAGRFNNVDLLLGFSVNGVPTDLAVVSDRGRDKLVIYKINPNYGSTVSPLTNVTASTVPWVFSTSQAQVNEQRTAYGLATAKGSFGAIGFVSQRERAKIRKVSFVATTSGRVSYHLGPIYSFPSTFTLPNGNTWTPCTDEDGVQPQFEGMVIDTHDQKLYAGQEPVGIWRMNLDGSHRTLVERVRSFGVNYTRVFDPDEEEFVCTFTTDPGFGGRHLTADVEGLTIYYVPNRIDERYLIASSQGDNTFSAWDIDKGKWQFEGTFAITFGSDLNEESDGAHVVSANLNPDYPLGLLVTQDGNNTPDVLDSNGDVIANTNFKFTPFHRVVNALGLAL